MGTDSIGIARYRYCPNLKHKHFISGVGHELVENQLSPSYFHTVTIHILYQYKSLQIHFIITT